MLNYIWLGLIVLAVVIGGCTDRLKEVTDEALKNAEFAVMRTALPLVGIMALWLGIMRLAERAGLVSLLARALRPVMRWLFPQVPPEHPAMGSMLMNMAASMLGLANAATPLGLRAMKDLESLNPHPGTATNAMCTFLAINTSSIQLIPVTAIAILAANGSSNPSAIVGTSIMAGVCSAICAVLAAKVLERLPAFRLPQTIQGPLSPSEVPTCRDCSPRENGGQQVSGPAAGVRSAASPVEKLPVKESVLVQPLPSWAGVVFVAFLLFFGYLFVRMAFPGALGLAAQEQAANQRVFIRILDAISRLSIPFMLSFFPLYAILRRVKVYEEFVEGAKEGFDVAIRIIPYLVAILVAIGMFRAAGGIDMLSELLKPIMNAVRFPADLLPLVIMRPLSGSGTLGIFTELVKHSGADSLVARMGGTIYGSTETTFYVLAVYFGSVGIKRTRHALLAGLTADFVAVVASLIVCRVVFG
jgi:spore maturation protein SpmA